LKIFASELFSACRILPADKDLDEGLKRKSPPQGDRGGLKSGYIRLD
jgi:hypothetical protein